MGLFRFDLHVHTRISPDGLSAPERVVQAAKNAGLAGIAITDHDRRGAYDRLVDLGLADPTGRPVDGFLVLPGVEVSTLQGHVLVLGATFDAPAGLSAQAVVARAHRLGALAVAAHPCDMTRSGLGLEVIDDLPFDAVEGWNSKTMSRGANDRAIAYAQRRGLPITAGSDAHFASTVGRAHTVIEATELRAGAVLEAIGAGRTELVRGQHTAGEIAKYLAQGWLTRPWLLDLTARTVAGKMRRRSAALLDAPADDLAVADAA